MPIPAIELIAAERVRQRKMGYTPEDDAAVHTKGQLAQAALCYTAHAAALLAGEGTPPAQPPTLWPWHPTAWNPKPTPRQNLIKAAALLAAEIDRTSNNA